MRFWHYQVEKAVLVQTVNLVYSLTLSIYIHMTQIFVIQGIPTLELLVSINNFSNSYIPPWWVIILHNLVVHTPNINVQDHSSQVLDNLLSRQYLCEERY